MLSAKFPYFILKSSHTPKMQALAKEIGGRKITGGYRFPHSMLVYDKLQERITGINQLDFPNDRGFILQDKGQDNHPKWHMLRDYQKETIDLLVSSPHQGMLVELSPGLGKSPVSALAADILGCKNVLFVTVKSLMRNWEREIKTWTGRDAQIRYQQEPVDGWNIVNYDTIVSAYKRSIHKDTAKRQPNRYMRKWDLVVLDESVLIKNRKSLRSKALNVLRAKANKRWCLTGSPTTRYADDLFSQLHFLDPRAFNSYWRFSEYFCIVEKSVWGEKIVGTKDNIDFTWALRDIVISYNQKDVLHLPPILHEVIDLEMGKEQQRVYDEMLASFVAELESGEEISAQNRISRLLRLQQIISSLENIGGGDYSVKADAVEEFIESEHVQYPLLIWVNWIAGARKLLQRLHKNTLNAVIAVGEEKDIEGTVEKYKQGQADILILSLGVGRYGMTLTNTNSVMYVDRTFDGDGYYQSLHRFERFGLNHSVQVVTLKCPGTVEDLIDDNLSGKLETISKITQADLAKLMRSLGR